MLLFQELETPKDRALEGDFALNLAGYPGCRSCQVPEG